VTYFRLEYLDGEPLGTIELARPDWRPGNLIVRGDDPNLRVVDLLEPQEPNGLAVLVVEEAA
jgi:hypothetical protein